MKERAGRCEGIWVEHHSLSIRLRTSIPSRTASDHTGIWGDVHRHLNHSNRVFHPAHIRRRLASAILELYQVQSVRTSLVVLQPGLRRAHQASQQPSSVAESVLEQGIVEEPRSWYLSCRQSSTFGQQELLGHLLEQAWVRPFSSDLSGRMARQECMWADLCQVPPCRLNLASLRAVE